MLFRTLLKLCAQLKRIYIIDNRYRGDKNARIIIPFEFGGEIYLRFSHAQACTYIATYN